MKTGKNKSEEAKSKKYYEAVVEVKMRDNENLSTSIIAGCSLFRKQMNIKVILEIHTLNALSMLLTYGYKSEYAY